MPAVDKRLLSAALIGALYLTNLMGIRSGARLQNLLSGLKVLLILGVAGVALLAAGVAPSTAAAPVESASASPLTLALGAALVPVFFTFGGYQMITNASADVREPQRNIPLGVLLGVGTVFTLYMLINVAYIHTLGLEAPLERLGQPLEITQRDGVVRRDVYGSSRPDAFLRRRPLAAPGLGQHGG